MSEQQQKPKSFMEELDEWTEGNILQPLFDAARDYDDEHTYDWDKAVEEVNKAIRAKTLDSYRNGQAKGPTTPRSRSFKPRRQSART